MLEKIIKKYHKKIAFSLYGILGIITMILPFVILGFGIFFVVTQEEKQGGILWIAVSLICFLFAFRKLKDFMTVYKYIFNPKKFPAYQKLIEDGKDALTFDQELEDADVLNKLSKQNPVIITNNFIFGYSQVSFFFLDKSKVIWAYEYNGNGIVFFDSHKIYGFTYFPTVDGNDILMEELKNDMPYIYLGTDFDYKTIMHDEFDSTVIRLENERLEFLFDPESYRIKKAEEERLRAEEEQKRLEALKEEENTESEDSTEENESEEPQEEESQEE